MSLPGVKITGVPFTVGAEVVAELLHNHNHDFGSYDLFFKTYELLVFGIFHLIFWDHSLPWVTEVVESKTMNKGRLMY